MDGGGDDDWTPGRIDAVLRALKPRGMTFPPLPDPATEPASLLRFRAELHERFGDTKPSGAAAAQSASAVVSQGAQERVTEPDHQEEQSTSAHPAVDSPADNTASQMEEEAAVEPMDQAGVVSSVAARGNAAEEEEQTTTTGIRHHMSEMQPKNLVNNQSLEGMAPRARLEKQRQLTYAKLEVGRQAKNKEKVLQELNEKVAKAEARKAEARKAAGEAAANTANAENADDTET